MSPADARSDAYKPVTLEQLKLVVGAPAPKDVFVFVPATQTYLMLVKLGDVVTKGQFENAKLLSGANLFVKNVAIDRSVSAVDAAKGLLADLTVDNAFEGETLGEAAGTALKGAYQLLLDPTGPNAMEASAVISDMADAILKVIVPESDDVRERVLKNLRNINFMNHSAAISSLAVLCALANDFKARTVFQNLTYSVLMMDSALAELEDHQLETYYRNRRELPQHVMEKVKNHPVKSQQIVAKLPLVNETINQLILGHHELHNGQGYHRGIKTGTSAPLARVLSLAVDIYEHIKGAELNGTAVSLRQVLMKLRELDVDTHNRRHSQKILDSVLIFLGIDPRAKV